MKTARIGSGSPGELEVRLERGHLAPEGVAADAEVDQPELVAVEHDHPGAGAEDRPGEAGDAPRRARSDAIRRMNVVDSPPGMHEAVEPGELRRLAHLDDGGAEPLEHRRVLADVSLQARGHRSRSGSIILNGNGDLSAAVHPDGRAKLRACVRRPGYRRPLSALAASLALASRARLGRRRLLGRAALAPPADARRDARLPARRASSALLVARGARQRRARPALLPARPPRRARRRRRASPPSTGALARDDEHRLAARGLRGARPVHDLARHAASARPRSASWGRALALVGAVAVVGARASAAELARARAGAALRRRSPRSRSASSPTSSGSAAARGARSRRSLGARVGSLTVLVADRARRPAAAPRRARAARCPSPPSASATSARTRSSRSRAGTGCSRSSPCSARSTRSSPSCSPTSLLGERLGRCSSWRVVVALAGVCALAGELTSTIGAGWNRSPAGCSSPRRRWSTRTSGARSC